MRIPIKFGRLRPLLVATGMPQSRCWVELSDTTLTVQMSWSFRAEIPTPLVASAKLNQGRAPLSIGVHGWRGRWLVNGSREGLVVITIDPPAKACAVGIPVALRELTVAVEDPVRLVTELKAML